MESKEAADKREKKGSQVDGGRERDRERDRWIDRNRGVERKREYWFNIAATFFFKSMKPNQSINQSINPPVRLKTDKNKGERVQEEK